MKYKMVVSDVDGTLVAPTAGRSPAPSARLIQTVKAVMDAGCRFSLATARSINGMPAVLEALNPNGVLILDNGSILYDCATKSMLWEAYVEKDIAVEVLRYLSDPKFRVFLVDDGHRIEYGPDVKLPAWKISKIVVMGLTPAQAQEAYADLVKFKGVHITRSISLLDPLTYAIHVTDAEATKGEALNKVKELFSIKTEEILVIGDSHNDVSLLKEGGFKVAMGNAEEEIKAMADFVAPMYAEDGVAEVLQKFILNETM
jgi:HAD superfamily hydrolase (TIGR01484 family)